MVSAIKPGIPMVNIAPRASLGEVLTNRTVLPRAVPIPDRRPELSSSEVGEIGNVTRPRPLRGLECVGLHRLQVGYGRRDDEDFVRALESRLKSFGSQQIRRNYFGETVQSCPLCGI